MINTKLYKLFSNLFFFLQEDRKIKLYKKINFFKRYSFWFYGFRKYEVIIFDDIFPVNNSPWRSFEFLNLLKEFPNSKVISSEKNKSFVGNSKFNERYRSIVKIYPEFKGKIKKEKLIVNINCKVIYFLFFNNVVGYREKLKKVNINFIFTLYPGGGWELNNLAKDKILLELIESSNCKYVIVNQYVTYFYLIDFLKVDPWKVKIIPGVPISLSNQQSDKTKFPKSEVLNIVFVGHRYLINGEDKGLPIFLELIKILTIETSINFKAIVVGDFFIEDFPGYEKIGNLIFLGKMNEEELSVFLESTDIIISPNQPFKLSQGAYDGFPLGSVVSAGIKGNLIFSTDYFNEGEKIGFLDKINFVKIEPDIIDIKNKVEFYLNHPDVAEKIIINSKKFIYDFYSYQNQILKRLEIFKDVIL